MHAVIAHRFPDRAARELACSPAFQVVPEFVALRANGRGAGAHDLSVSPQDHRCAGRACAPHR